MFSSNRFSLSAYATLNIMNEVPLRLPLRHSLFQNDELEKAFGTLVSDHRVNSVCIVSYIIP